MPSVGTYECGFISGSVKYVAETELTVALLPEEIHMKFNPPTVQCRDTSDVISNITVNITNSAEPYNVTWQSSVLKLSEISKTCKTLRMTNTSLTWP